MQKELSRLLETIKFDDQFFSTLKPSIKEPDIRQLIVKIAIKQSSIISLSQALAIQKDEECNSLIDQCEDSLKQRSSEPSFFIPENTLNTLKKCLFLAKEKHLSYPEIYVRLEDSEVFKVGKMTTDRIFSEVAALIIATPFGAEVTADYLKALSGTKKHTPKIKWLSTLVEQYLCDYSEILTYKPLSWNCDEIGVLAGKVLNKNELDKYLHSFEPLKYWGQILNRLSSPTLFMSWCWSLFSAEHCTRQIMWIRGAGNDGKTTLSNAITEFLGASRVSAWDLDAKTKNQFTNSKFLGKVLAVNSETHIHQILEDRSVFRITGNDIVDVEQKNQSSFSAQINAHMLFTANHAPRINTFDPAQLSRILYVEISGQDRDGGGEFKSDTSFKDCLISEMYPFLAQCKCVYYMRKLFSNESFTYRPLLEVLNNSKFRSQLIGSMDTALKTDRIKQTSEEVELMKSSCTMHSVAYVSEFFEKFLIDCPEGKLKITALRSLFFEESKEYHYSNIADYNRLLFLINMFGYKTDSDGRYIKGLAFKSSPETDTAPSVGDWV